MKDSTKKLLLYVTIIILLICVTGGITIGVRFVINNEENESNYCFADDESPVRLYGIKGIYDFENSVLIKPNLSSACEPKQVWTIIRHGVRYPEGIQIPDYELKLPIIQKEIMENYEKKMYSKHKKLCNKDLENIKNWKLHPNVSIETAYHLSEFGRKQMLILADRFKEQYPNIFNIPYSEEDFQFLHTYTEDCVLKSFEAFFEGLFEKPFNENYEQKNRQVEGNMDFEALEKNRIKIQNQRVSTEAIRFTEKPIFLNMLSNISVKLRYNPPLNWTTVKILFDICRYDYGWNIEKISPWCAFFSENEQKILEYYEDLACYYEYGFGNELARDMGCNQIKSLIYNFMKVANGDKHPKAVVHTSHRAYFETLQVALDITKDPYILTADNFETAQDRKWRTTNDGPYAMQFTVVFYSCSNEEKYVHFTMNEKSLDEINYPGCKDGLCPWNSVFNRLKPIADTCNLD